MSEDVCCVSFGVGGQCGSDGMRGGVGVNYVEDSTSGVNSRSADNGPESDEVDRVSFSGNTLGVNSQRADNGPESDERSL